MSGTIIENKPINGREIALYGAGHDAQYIKRILTALGIFPECFVVSTEESRSKILQDNLGKILLVDEINASEYFVIVASSIYYEEMETLINKKGFIQEEDYFIWRIFEPTIHDWLVAYFAENSPLDSEALNRVYFNSCNSLRTILALTTNPNRDYRVRFCFPDKHNHHLELPEVIYKEDMNTFIEEIMTYRSGLIEGIRSGTYLDGYCKECTRKKKTVWLDDNKFEVINVGGHPAPCNFKCSYCDARSNDDTVSFSAKLLSLYDMTLNTLKQKDQISDKAVVKLANGEITINPVQSGYLSLANGYSAGILTNASVFSVQVAEKLTDGKSHIQVSVDAGTKETFVKSKGVNAFDKVSENLKKYKAYGNVILKYILIPGFNDNEADYNGIIALLKELSLESLWVSTDMFMMDDHTTYLMVEPLTNFVRYLKKNGIRAYGYTEFLEEASLDQLLQKLSEVEGE